MILDDAGVKALATLPSINELRGKIAGLLQAPAASSPGSCRRRAASCARVLGAYAAKGGTAASGEAAKLDPGKVQA